MYDLTLLNIADGYEEAVRIKLGVDSTELPDDTINSLSILGAVESDIYDYVSAINTITDAREINYLNLAFINLAAYYTWPGLRLRLIQIESDNKTVAQRFAKALDFDPLVYQQEAYKYLAKVTSTPRSTTADIAMFDVVSPATDELTGNTN